MKDSKVLLVGALGLATGAAVMAALVVLAPYIVVVVAMVVTIWYIFHKEDEPKPPTLKE
jgi:hypothetical protein